MNSKGFELLNEVYQGFLANGAAMFIATRLKESEPDHARAYYEFMAPHTGAVIVDMGSGIGEHGAYFQAFDPTLAVINVVNDPALIAIMKEKGRCCLERSFIDTGLPDNFADNVMFNESIGYENLAAGFAEAARIVKPGGIITIKDFSLVDPRLDRLYLDQWSYVIYRKSEMIEIAERSGLSLETLTHPKFYIKHWFDIMANSEAARHSANEHDPNGLPLCLSMYRFRKGSLDGFVN